MMGFGLIFLSLIAGAIAYASGWRPSWGQRASNGPGRSALDIARERYARGEITREQYEEIRAKLSR